MRPKFIILLFAFISLQTFAQGISVTDTVPISSPLLFGDANGVYFQTGKTASVGKVSINGEEKFIPIKDGKAYLTDELSFAGNLFYVGASDGSQLIHISKNKDGGHRIKQIPLWLSVVPPLLAIILALIFKEVIISLFMGIWSGAFIAGGLRLDSIYYFISSIFNVVKEFVIDALNDRGHISVIVFSLLIGGMVAIISKNGGMVGVVNVLTKYAKSAKSSQLVTWFLGIAIFFDDYANTLIVGNTMRPVTDKFRVSREKLSYIVDATAAPVAAIAFITTWIGAELGYIDDGLQQIGLDTQLTPYGVFKPICC
ncbi:MAG TPA: Na+/H+ antiporter NhaC family protein, partial [Saprospiraceae bacterium]|nr:Na+/H+ antiporter NhaC family protein [Saprospiraceae bacterium]